MRLNLISPATAYEIASQWGSLIRNGDPGAVFYSFPVNDARPQDEAHRAALIAYTDDCLSGLREDREDYAEDFASLTALRAFFVASPLSGAA